MARTRDDDACPGALQTHRAADGALARVRLPGGMITAAQLEAVALAAIDFGSSAMELTSRGNIQIRGVPDTVARRRSLAGAGLLPSHTHERVRNIVASPLSGRIGGVRHPRTGRRTGHRDAGTSPRSPACRADSCSASTTAAATSPGWLPTRASTPSTNPPRSCWPAVTPVCGWRYRRGRRAAGGRHPIHRDARKELACQRTRRHRRCSTATPVTAQPGTTWPAVTRPPVGWIEQNDGRVALGAAVPLGVLDARDAEYLAAVDAPMAVTPWRSVLLFDLDEGIADVALRVLAPMGLVFDENSPWLSVSACTGSPGCEHSAADVRADAAAAVDEPAVAVTGTSSAASGPAAARPR